MKRVILVALVLAVIGPVGPPAHAAEEPVRILLYGDSLTHGNSGDYTYRYRLWKHLAPTGPVDFVGPRNDMVNFRTIGLGNQEYADPAFDRDHAAMGGLRFTQPYPGYELDYLSWLYQPDVVVGLIGGIDLFQGIATPQQLTDHWRAKIAAVRAVDPGVKVVLVQQPQPWYPGVPEYNQLLVALAAELDTPAAPVRVTAPAQLDKLTETWDMIHPTAMGEVKLAAVVADALAGLGVGTTYPQPLPTIPDGPVWAPQQSVARSGDTVTVTWPVVDYAGTVRVEVLDETDGTEVSADVPAAAPQWSMTVVSGHRYRVWLRPIKGYIPSATHSAPSYVSDALPEVEPPTPPLAAPPKVAPQRLRARVLGPHRLRVRWVAAAGAVGYRVEVARAGKSWAKGRSRAVSGTTVVVGGLRAGTRYRIRVAGTWPEPGPASHAITVRLAR